MGSFIRRPAKALPPLAACDQLAVVDQLAARGRVLACDELAARGAVLACGEPTAYGAVIVCDEPIALGARGARPALPVLSDQGAGFRPQAKPPAATRWTA